MIRPATPQDIPALLALGRAMHAESWYGYLPFDEQKLSGLLARLIGGEGFVEVYETEGHVNGVMVGAISEMWFCRAGIACDLALFVYPGRRGSIAACRLTQRFIEWARAHGAAEVCMAVSTGVRIQETGRLYEALGLTHVGGIYKARL